MSDLLLTELASQRLEWAAAHDPRLRIGGEGRISSHALSIDETLIEGMVFSTSAGSSGELSRLELKNSQKPFLFIVPAARSRIPCGPRYRHYVRHSLWGKHL